jgi:hypothetical protein
MAELVFVMDISWRVMILMLLTTILCPHFQDWLSCRTMAMMNRVFLAFLFGNLFFFGSQVCGLTETERVAEYRKRYGDAWPPKEYVPNTPGWRQLMEKRLAQTAQIGDYDEKYEAYMQVQYDVLFAANNMPRVNRSHVNKWRLHLRLGCQ